ncbi:MAG TPA: hypothetical protein VLZ84_00795 [Asticcacaulis sp.]|nr:hypothetical protein [Asticcacaulis sp.]
MRLIVSHVGLRNVYENLDKAVAPIKSRASRDPDICLGDDLAGNACKPVCTVPRLTMMSDQDLWVRQQLIQQAFSNAGANRFACPAGALLISTKLVVFSSEKKSNEELNILTREVSPGGGLEGQSREC